MTELIPVASEKSIGKKYCLKEGEYPVVGIRSAIDAKACHSHLFGSGGTSLEWAPRFAEAGITVIDNSSAWRMDPDKKLVVPSANAHVLSGQDRIIANPIAPRYKCGGGAQALHDKYRIRRVVVSTYQSVTGTGVKRWNS